MDPAILHLGMILLATILVLLPVSAIMSRYVRRKRLRSNLKSLLRHLTDPFRFGFRIATLTQRREQTLRTQQLVLENFPMTPLQFFAYVQDAIEERQIPGVNLHLITRRQVGFGGSRRRYLCVTYQSSICIVGAVPLGTAFVVSWRCGELATWARLILLEHPVLYSTIDWFIRPPTFYRIDVNEAFQQLMQRLITDVITNVTEPQVVRVLNETERQQILGEPL
jgi:hypothetical protein